MRGTNPRCRCHFTTSPTTQFSKTAPRQRMGDELARRANAEEVAEQSRVVGTDDLSPFSEACSTLFLMPTTPTVQAAVDRLVAAGHPRKVILFGSHARGEATEESDVDFLVIVRATASRRADMIRLRNALRPLRIPADVLVATEDQITEWGDVPGTVLYDALRDGRIVYEAA